MNGIEMMLVNILQGVGFDPKDIMQKATSLIATVEGKLDSFDNRLSRIEKALGILEPEEIKQLDNKIADELHDFNK